MQTVNFTVHRTGNMNTNLRAWRNYRYDRISGFLWFLADRTNGRAIGTVLRLSVV